MGCAAGFLLADRAAQAQPANLTHRYNFNSDARDSVGGADGVLQGGASVSGGALVLDGISGYLALPANLVTGYAAITSAILTCSDNPNPSGLIRSRDL